MATATIPAFDLSRPRLRQTSHWIRDELDPLVAREGPGLLRADDVLTLHDVFQALKTSSSVTALDLRATGIHRAVMEISGIATRWPGRLADDCDDLIDLWRGKFGRLEDLHPFLYGRGGRLEGIASIEETSKIALLKRWQNSCPDRISPKRARRRGSLGFHPGSWWINTLFACHAGIIDVDTIDGGVCYDKYGAYAMVILEGGELDAPTESTLTYRCGKDDRGRFRLTAATPRSREPLRVLRSHSVNSMWGPKAGVRYEGLYRVTGWAVHQPRTSSSHVGQKTRLGDVYFDVHLERCDPVPVHEVAKSPTASELDDYSEYKRLRKVHRDLRNKANAASVDATNMLPVPVKVAPAIPPPAPAPSGKVLSFKVSPVVSRSTTFTWTPGKEPPGASQYVSGGSPTITTEGYAYVTPSQPTIVSIPAAIPFPLRAETQRSEQLRLHTPPGSKGTVSIASTSKSRQPITEVAPWIDQELPHLILPTNADLALIKRSTIRSHVVTDESDSPISAARTSNRKDSGDEYSVLLHHTPSIRDLDLAIGLRAKESSKSKLVRSRNPVAKLFDGTEDEASSPNDYFPLRRPRAASAQLKHPLVASRRRERANSTEHTPQPVAPIPVRHESSSPLLFKRRDALVFPYGYVVSLLAPPDQSSRSFPCYQSPETASTQEPPTACTGSLLTSLKDFIGSRLVATTSDEPTSPSRAVQTDIHSCVGHCDALPMRAQTPPRPQDLSGEVQELEITVAFCDPFQSPRRKHDTLRNRSCNVSPRTIA
ncbi:uncharacterized protein CC84DRAFT_1208697 [Paraphaeosphaeria sporulosa]|uniref:YDG domain-containing protein n=1 Tax=Paraphaeosphaeria sporulosa TaxID=1460663 RepID=A0A177C4J1_9PLEO|nr:uncharacterized protein CC84DRAFT_1208697 [Paraphaeosphaeria sporulosa]OAG01590.1 hypothetical protein CC84DRAFT_1208697 [Paraphaeosphaeria sporulosa]